jgi:arginyl-tRNA synthetase
MKAYISELLTQAVQTMNPDEAGAVLGSSVFDVSYPKPEYGDYATNAAMVLYKKFAQAPAKSPAEFAVALAAEISKIDHQNSFSKVEAVGGFINFSLTEQFLLKRVRDVLEQKHDFGKSELGGRAKILLEYFQPNVAKPLHLGHLENGILGDALFRILQFTGSKVESDTHLGDWGTQFGLLLLAYKKWGDMETIKQDPIPELNKLYVRINAEMEAEEDLREQGKQEFVKLEQGDEENLQLWQQFKDWSWQEFEFMYEKVGIRRADHDWPESFYADHMPQVVAELKERGLLKESQGAQIVDLDEHGLGVAVIVKSDGGTTYLLRDLATFIYRKSQGFSQQLYVVDARQSQTLAQTFKILELLGHITSPLEAKHISYGFLKLPDGAMSTRKGSIIGAKELLDDAVESAEKIIQEKNPALQNKSAVALQVANAAIKYFLLSRNLRGDIVFEKDQAISFEGNTGPYLQYTHARIHGIFRKAEADGQSLAGNSEGIANLDPSELAVMRKIQHFPEIVEQIAQQYSPNLLCNYLFELAQCYNAFYQELPVLKEADEQKRKFRVSLSKATSQILHNGFALLGIDAPEEM